MRSIIMLFLASWAGCFPLVAQSSEIRDVLEMIERNNPELEAFRAQIEYQQLQLQAGNNLPDPQVGAFYLPFGDHEGSDYWEFQITQRVEFPSVYTTRSQWLDEQRRQMELEWDRRRQQILLEATHHYLETVHLNRRMEVENQRTAEARQVYDQINTSYEKEAKGILDLNKAKVAWMQIRFRTDQLANEKRKYLLQLQELNGGEPVSVENTTYPARDSLPPAETLWQEKLERDPTFTWLQQREQVAQQEIRLREKEGLPDLTAGINYQGVPASNYYGLFAGVSVPLWSNRHRKEAAQEGLVMNQALTQLETRQMRTEFDQLYSDYELLRRRYQIYQQTLEGLKSEALLFQAYELGEISFAEYYTELKFFWEAFDTYLEMEKELHQLEARLLQYQL